jgi:hypothetical protein
MSPRVLVEIDQLLRFPDGLKRCFLDRFGVPNKRDHCPVVVLVRMVVKNANAFD